MKEIKGTIYRTWFATALEMFKYEAGLWGSSVVRHVNGARTCGKTRTCQLDILWLLGTCNAIDGSLHPQV